MEEEKKSFEIEGGGRKQEKKIRYIFKPPKGLHFRNAADIMPQNFIMASSNSIERALSNPSLTPKRVFRAFLGGKWR